MKKIIFAAICLAYTTFAGAQKSTPTFKGFFENKQYDVYLKIDFYKKNIIVPNQEILGEMAGFFGDYHDGRRWLIVDADIKPAQKELETDSVANLSISNDYGSEDLTARFYKNTDDTYTLEQLDGSTLKIARNRKWVKMPKRLVFNKK